MARAKNRPNQRGVPLGPRRNDRVLKTAGRPTPRTGAGMLDSEMEARFEKLATKKPPIRGPKSTDTGGRVVTPKKKPPMMPADLEYINVPSRTVIKTSRTDSIASTKQIFKGFEPKAKIMPAINKGYTGVRALSGLNGGFLFNEKTL